MNKNIENKSKKECIVKGDRTLKGRKNLVREIGICIDAGPTALIKYLNEYKSLS